MVLGVLSITDYSHFISAKSLNLWWPVQYGLHVVSEILHGTAGPWRAVLGGRYPWQSSIPAADLSKHLGFNVEIIGFLIFAVFTVLNLRYVLRRMSADRSAIIVAAALQVYGYFILRVGVQVNHYFLLVALLTLTCCFSDRALVHWAWVITVFLFQDLVFYGFGRDFDYGVSFLSKFYLGWTTVFVAVVNVCIFVYLCWHHYRQVTSRSNVSADAASLASW